MTRSREALSQKFREECAGYASRKRDMFLDDLMDLDLAGPSSLDESKSVDVNR